MGAYCVGANVVIEGKSGEGCPMADRWCLLSLLAVLFGLAGAGCAQTCEVLCSENGRYIDGCLEYWGAVWPDFGYDGLQDFNDDELEIVAGTPYGDGPIAEYEDRCNARYRNAMRFGGPENIRVVKVGCRDDLTALSESIGCLDYVPVDLPELDPTDGDNGTAPQPTR
jgi:hypothetical protein